MKKIGSDPLVERKGPSPVVWGGARPHFTSARPAIGHYPSILVCPAAQKHLLAVSWTAFLAHTPATTRARITFTVTTGFNAATGVLHQLLL